LLGAVLSGSVAAAVEITSLVRAISATLAVPLLVKAGASLKSVTEIVNCFSVVSPPASVERTRIK